MPNASSVHEQHDLLLVVSLAADDLAGPDRDQATALVERCSDCRLLHDDLLAIARATAALPAAVRPRDFRLSSEDAARLRPLGWRRFIAAFASPQLALTRQLGIGLTTLGLAGLLFSALPSIPLPFAGGTTGAAPVTVSTDGAEPDVAGGAATEATAQPAPAAASAAPRMTTRSASGSYDTMASPAASSDGALGALPIASPSAEPFAAQGESPDEAAPVFDGADSGRAEDYATPGLIADGQRMSLLLVGSTIMLAAGIALLVARRLARRIVNG
jgi:hypothetical protein